MKQLIYLAQADRTMDTLFAELIKNAPVGGALIAMAILFLRSQEKRDAANEQRHQQRHEENMAERKETRQVMQHVAEVVGSVKGVLDRCVHTVVQHDTRDN
jgi:hypothetical protein